MSFLICTRTLGPLVEKFLDVSLEEIFPNLVPSVLIPWIPLSRRIPLNLAAELSGSSPRLKSAAGHDDVVINASAPEHL